MKFQIFNIFSAVFLIELCSKLQGFPKAADMLFRRSWFYSQKKPKIRH